MISKFLFQRNSIWYLQFRIPTKIQSHFKQALPKTYKSNSKLRLSLRTQDYKQACATAIPIVAVLSQIAITRSNNTIMLQLSNQLLTALADAEWKHGEKLAPVIVQEEKRLETKPKAKIKNSIMSDIAYEHKITTISAALNFYCKSKMTTGEWTEKARKSSQSKYRALHELFGKWRLDDLPINASERVVKSLREMANLNRKPYRNLSAKEVVKMDKPDSDKWSIRQIECTYQELSSCFNFLSREDKQIVTRNPFKNIKIRAKGQTSKKREPFSNAQLEALFSSPVHTSLGYSRKRHSDYWLDLLMLYTGARIGELAYLSVADIGELDGCNGQLILDTLLGTFH